MKMISGKMIFFFRVWLHSENILQCCVKDRIEGVGVAACVFGKWFTKKKFVNHFPNFNKGFSGQRKLFSI